MRNTIVRSSIAHTLAVALLALLPGVATAQQPLSWSGIQESISTTAKDSARVSVAEMSGLLVWAWRGESSDRMVAEPLHLMHFSATPSRDLEPASAARLFEFADTHPADRGRLDHVGNLFRIDF